MIYRYPETMQRLKIHILQTYKHDFFTSPIFDNALGYSGYKK